jgi:hypothetical protein
MSSPHWRYYPGISLMRLRRTTGYLSQGSRCLGRASNRSPPEYKSEVLTFEPTCSVLQNTYRGCLSHIRQVIWYALGSYKNNLCHLPMYPLLPHTHTHTTSNSVYIYSAFQFITFLFDSMPISTSSFCLGLWHQTYGRWKLGGGSSERMVKRSKTLLRGCHTFSTQSYGRKVLCVQQHLRYAYFCSHCMFKIRSSNFIMIT